MTLHLVPPAGDEGPCCDGCGAAMPDVPVGLPEGWDGSFRAGRWTVRCGDCAGGDCVAPSRKTAPVLAIYRPLANDILLSLEHGPARASVTLTIVEARMIHGTLERALMLAEVRDDPLAAMDGRFDPPRDGGGGLAA